jgi:hypothetical protein
VRDDTSTEHQVAHNLKFYYFHWKFGNRILGFIFSS